MVSGQGPLRGQVGVVTGGNKGIGMAIAQKLAALGVTVYIVGRTERALQQAAAKIQSEGHSCITYQADITKTTVFGKPTARQTEIWNLERQAQDA